MIRNAIKCNADTITGFPATNWGHVKTDDDLVKNHTNNIIIPTHMHNLASTSLSLKPTFR